MEFYKKGSPESRSQGGGWCCFKHKHWMDPCISTPRLLGEACPAHPSENGTSQLLASLRNGRCGSGLSIAIASAEGRLMRIVLDSAALCDTAGDADAGGKGHLVALGRGSFLLSFGMLTKTPVTLSCLTRGGDHVCEARHGGPISKASSPAGRCFSDPGRRGKTASGGGWWTCNKGWDLAPESGDDAVQAALGLFLLAGTGL